MYFDLVVYLFFLYIQCFDTLTLLVWRQEGHLACKKTRCWFVGGDDLTGALHVIAPVVTATYTILISSKIQNGDILVPANPGPSGKMAVKMEREYICFPRVHWHWIADEKWSEALFLSRVIVDAEKRDMVHFCWQASVRASRL